MRSVAESQCATRAVSVRRIADGCPIPGDVGEVDRVIPGEPGDGAGKAARLVELQRAARAGVEAYLGVGRGGEFEAARSADLGRAAAGQIALDDQAAGAT